MNTTKLSSKLLILLLLYAKITIASCCIVNSPIATITSGLVEPHGVRFSPDGSCLVVADKTTVKVYTSTGGCAGFNGATPVATINNGGTSTFSAVFSPDGQCIAASDRGQLPVPTGIVNFYTTSDGTCAGFNGALSIASLNSANATTQIREPLGIAYSPDGNCFTVANQSGPNPFKIYSSTATGCAKFNNLSPISTVNLTGRAIDFSPSGSCLAITSGTQVRFYAPPAGSCNITAANFVASIIATGTNTPDLRGVSFFPDGTCIAVGDLANSTVSVYTSSDGTCAGFNGATPISTIQVLATTGSEVFEIDVSPDGTCIAVTISGISPSTTPQVVIYPMLTSNINATGPTTICQNEFTTLVVDAQPTVTYQWQLNGVDIPGATGTSYNATTSGSYTVISTVDTCSLPSNAITITVNPLPGATITPAGSTTVCAGQSVILNANTGTGFTYQWQLGGIDIPGATNSSYSASTAGSYTVIVTSADGCISTSTPVVVTVNPLPTATATAAGPNTFCAGGSVTLNANTGANLIYQWQNNATNIPGETNSSYVATTSGSYTVIVTSTTTTCGATSNAISVTVNPVPAATISPNGPINLCAGQSVTLNANTGTGLTYQWQLGGIDIPGATNSSFIVTASGSYTVVVTTTALCSATSAPVVVTVNPLPTATATAAGPTTFCAGGSVTLNANIGANLTYQWQNNGTNIPGETNSSYVATTSGSYTVIVTSTTTTCSATSNAISVTVNPVPAAIITPSGPINLCAGQSVTLNANTGTGLTYQWQLNGSDIPGETNASLVVSTSGSYTVIVTATPCSATSTAVIVTVNPLPAATITPVGPTRFCAGESVTLNANTGANLAYQWQNNGIDIPGETNSSYVATTSGSYTVIVTSTTTGCSSTSTPVMVTVNPLPAAIITPSRSPNLCTGDSITLTANTGTGLSYQWQLDGTDLPGETTDSITVNTAGSYTVIVTVTATGCSSTSVPTVVTVNPLPAATITPTGPITICQGDTALLQANTGTGLNYQWFINGTAIAGATTDSYDATMTGNYTVLVTTDAGCSTLSNTVVVLVNPLPVATIAAIPNRISPGDSAVLIATPTIGTAPFQIIWSDGLVQDNVIISAERTVQPTTTTQYSFIVVDANGCVSDPADTITLFVCSEPSPISPLAHLIFQKFCGNC